MKPVTTDLTESFIFVEMPALRAKCDLCGQPIMKSNNRNYQVLKLVVGYRKREVEIDDGGRTFEKVPEKYLHICPKPLAEAQSNSFRGASLGEPALL